jgi:hypothetical protein
MNSLQPILGTDKKNPVISMYKDESKNKLHVYYGFELLEIVPNNKSHPSYKLLAARLYNAGLKVKSLVEIFKFDRKTLKKVGDVLKSGDTNQIIKIINGKENNRKLTADVILYINFRFPSIYNETKYNYSKCIREEIRIVFKKKISAETIRPILKALKETFKSIEVTKESLSEEKRDNTCDYIEGTNNLNIKGKHVNLSDNNEIEEEKVLSKSDINSDNRKLIPSFCEENNSEVKFCHHIGLLIFSNILLKVENYFKDKSFLIKQWLSAVLLDAVNIEQTKLLDFDALAILLGKTLQTLHTQRQYLKDIATPENFKRLLQFNGDEINIHYYNDFYYDPHTKRYTGEMKALKGWCGNIRMADKVLYMDFIHTSTGKPVYIKHRDNYNDLRECFMPTIKDFRESLEIPKEKVLTFIVDRGIYDIKVFQNIINNPTTHIVTWTKGYKPKRWNSTKVTGSFIFQRSRNYKEDKLTYQFEYIENDWIRDNNIKELEVQATNHKGNTIQVGILTDDKSRNAKEIIVFMFKRWIQENDFKYLDKHYGINEITSYTSIPYKLLKDQVEKKQMKNGEYKALEMNRKDILKKLGNYLIKEHQNRKKNPKREKQIESLDEELKSIEYRMKSIEKEIPRLDFLIEQNYFRLNTQSKSIMDAIKILARNIFYNKIELFKELYNNFRDDHVIFRNLIQSPGYLIEKDNIIEAYILPTKNYSDKLKRIIKKVLDDINKLNPQLPYNSGKKFRLFLGKKEGFKLAISKLQKL